MRKKQQLLGLIVTRYQFQKMSKPTNFVKFYNQYLKCNIPENYNTANEFVTDCPNEECPNPEKHLYVNLESGLCHCKRCDSGWNPVQLITLLHSQALATTTAKQYQYISDLRGISVDTLEAAGLAYDQLHDRWFIPYYSFDPKTKEWKENLVNLGIFYPANTRDPFVIHKGATLSFSLYNPGLHDEDADYKHIKIFEGEWDTLAFYDYRFTTDKTVPLGKPGA